MKAVDTLCIYLKKKKQFAAIVLVIIITALFYLPIIKDLSKTVISENDWWRNYYYAGLSRKTVIEYHQLPLRTPFMGGGYPTIGHPMDFSLSPFFLFILIFKEIIGLRITVFLFFIISALGMFYLTRYVLRFSLLGGFFSSLTLILCNWGAYEIVDGNLQKLFYYLFPWLFAFFIKAKESIIFILLSALILSLILLNSGLILPPIFLFLFLFSCLNIVEKKMGYKTKINIFYISILFVIVGLACLLCAVKIVPFLQLYSTKINLPYIPYKNSYSFISVSIKNFGSCLNLDRLWKSLLDPKFRDYSVMYFGYIPIIIFILSFLIYRKEMLRYTILLMIFAIIQFGPNSPIDLFKILWSFRPFKYDMWRLDKYFGFFIPFLICLIGGRFFSIFEKKRKFFQVSALAIIIIGIGNMYWQNRLVFQDMIYEKIPMFRKYDSFFQVEVKKFEIERRLPGYFESKDMRSYQTFWILLQQNIGLTNFILHGTIDIGEHAVSKYVIDPEGLKGECAFVKGYEDISKFDIVDLISSGKANPSYRGEVFPLNEDDEAKMIYFSPNRIEINVKLNTPGKLVINQNYHRSWRTNNGRLTNYRGLLALELSDKGSHIIRLTYLPLDFYVGLLVSVMTCIGIAGYIMHLYKRKAYLRNEKNR